MPGKGRPSGGDQSVAATLAWFRQIVVYALRVQGARVTSECAEVSTFRERVEHLFAWRPKRSEVNCVRARSFCPCLARERFA